MPSYLHRARFPDAHLGVGLGLGVGVGFGLGLGVGVSLVLVGLAVERLRLAFRVVDSPV